MNLVLDGNELRVLGALVEKQITTPEYYPLTLMALVAACNQKSNREPVMTLAPSEAAAAVERLREKHLAWLVDAAGARVPKYSHNIAAQFSLTLPQTAILCELMIRGPQTAGELRVRSARLCAWKDIPEVEAALESLASRPDGALVVKLAREPGRRECRYAHLLAGEVTAPAEPAAANPAVTPSRDERMTALEQEVQRLHAELETLRQSFADFRKQFG